MLMLLPFQAPAVMTIWHSTLIFHFISNSDYKKVSIGKNQNVIIAWKLTKKISQMVSQSLYLLAIVQHSHIWLVLECIGFPSSLFRLWPQKNQGWCDGHRHLGDIRFGDDHKKQIDNQNGSHSSINPHILFLWHLWWCLERCFLALYPQIVQKSRVRYNFAL